MHDVRILVLSQIGRLYLFWSEKDINQITVQHRSLVDAMDVKQDFQLSLRACSSLSIFDDAWELPCLRGRFKKLLEFCGGLATVLPSTASVESDFSLLKFRKTVFSRSLTDFSMERCW